MAGSSLPEDMTGPPWAWVRYTSMEAWDQDSGSFAPAGSLEEAHGEFTLTLLPDDRVLITGGDDDANQAMSTVELSDPGGASFAVVGSLTVARSGHTETLLPDGQVLLVGGGHDESGTMVHDSAELFDPDAVIASGSADSSAQP